jgi:hypothetical protein
MWHTRWLAGDRTRCMAEPPPKWSHALTVIGGIGVIGLGVVAKAFNSHSTPEEVQQAGLRAAGEIKKS